MTEKEDRGGKVRFSPLPKLDSPRNWTEDYPHENGMYLNKCFQCEKYFFGHKRRPMCKECVEKYDAS